MPSNESSLSQIVEQSLNEIYVFDVESLKFVYANEASRQNLEYSLEELEQMTPLDIKPDHTIDSFMELVAPLAEDITPTAKIVFETRHQRKSGSLYPVEIHIQRGTYNNKQVYIVFALDFTSRNQQQSELQRFRSAIDASPDSIYFTDVDSMRFLYVNAAAAKRTGFSQEQLLGMGPEDIMIYDSKKIKSDYDRAIAASPEGTVEEVELRKSGWSELRRSALLLEDRWVIITTARNITERKKNKIENLQFRRAIEASPDGITITDVETLRFQYVNAVGIRRAGYSLEELMEMGPEDVFHASREEVQQMFEEVIAAGEEGTVTELEIITKTGELLLTEIRRYALLLGDRWVIISISHDLSKRVEHELALQQAHEELEQRVKERTAQLELEVRQRQASEQRATRAQEEMRVAKEEAEKSSRAKTEFLSSMSHELRTPLNCILGFAQLLELSQAEFDEKYNLHVGQILSSGEHLLKLVTDVLELHTIEEGRLSLQLGNVSADEVVADCLSQIRFRAQGKNVQLIDQRNPQQPLPLVWSDVTRLKQLLLNLLSNAIKYNKEGGTVTISYSEIGGKLLRISVSDTGSGIPVGRRKSLFIPFERLGRESGPIEGTGIGLSIAKRLIEMLNGNIGYETEEGQGSTFWVDIPLSDERQSASSSDNSASKAVLEEPDPAPSGRNTKLLLYIEDDPDNQSLMQHILARLPEVKIELLTAHNAELGIDLAREHHPDVILLDINLPGMSGLEAVRQLKAKQETHAIPVIAISADATPQAIETAMNCGFEAYITKPINVKELQGTVSKFLKSADTP